MKLKLPLLLSAALLLTGCFGGDVVKPQPAPLVEFKPAAALKLLWQAQVGGTNGYVFAPAVVGAAVFAAASDGTLARIEEGREVWRINAGQPLSGGVGADRERVAVGTVKGEVLTFDAATGAARWRAQTYADILAAPAVGEGLVAVRSGDSRVYGFDSASGARKWLYQRTAPTLTLRSNAGVLLAEGALFAGFPGGKMVVLNLTNGAVLWEGAVAQPKGATEIERIADVASLPVVDGRMGCAAAYQGRVACFDFSAGGAPLWTKDISSRSGVDMDRSQVYVSDDKGAVHSFERSTGASLWKQDKLGNRGLARPLALARHVVVADSLGVVHVLQRDDGAFAARVETDSSGVAADAQRIPGGFVVQTRSGGIYAYRIE